MEDHRKNTAIYSAFDEDEPFDMAQPEKELLRAVLMSALSDAGRPGREGRKAQEFFLNPDDSYLYSFQSICNHLEIDPNTILVVAGLKPSGKARMPLQEGRRPRPDERQLLPALPRPLHPLRPRSRPSDDRSPGGGSRPGRGSRPGG